MTAPPRFDPDPRSPASPVISPEDLAARMAVSDPALRIVDVRWYLGAASGVGRQAFERGHIPGAIFLDLDADLVASDGPGRHPLPEPADFAHRLAGAGIGSGSFVVAYDDVGGWVAARLWWMLDDLGHRGVAVLDGGFPAWTSAGLPVTRAEPRFAPVDPGELHLAERWTKTIDRAELKSRLGTVVLLDARAGPRYRGETEPIDPVAGHIPTARNHPTDRNLGPDGRFLPAAELATRLDALGAAAADRRAVVTSCGSGVSACHTSLAMRLAGLPDPLLYPGSYSDWSRSGEPVVVGPEPGDPPVA